MQVASRLTIARQLWNHTAREKKNQTSERSRWKLEVSLNGTKTDVFLTEPFLVGCQRLPLQLGLQAGTAGFYPFAKTGEDLVESIQSIRERALAKPLSSPSSPSLQKRARGWNGSLKRHRGYCRLWDVLSLSRSPCSRVQLSLYLIGGSGELISLLYCCLIQAFSSSVFKSLWVAKDHSSKRSF